MTNGRVFLVGGGPGDVKLVTVKGKEALEKADVIVYDRLINPKLLDYAKPDCELIYGGKLPKRHIMRQEQINDLLVAKAKEGKTVVRLKGGDPSIFGRVGEEAAQLTSEGISYEIVPGITSGVAAPVYAGIPVTHRDYGTSFTVVTAHGNASNGQPKVDWKSLKGIDTIAFYMGISNLSFLSENLIQHGKSPDTPVILLQWGTYSRQKSLEGTLATIASQAKAINFQNPAIILVGDIVKIRDKMNWFESKPLFGRQIIVARTSNGASRLATTLEEQGADVIMFPKWKKELASINSAQIQKLIGYDSILFQSPDSVDTFLQTIVADGIDAREIKATFYVQSVKSQRALQQRGFQATITKWEDIPMENLLVVKEEYASNKENKLTDYDVWITSYKSIDDQYKQVFNHMLESMTLDTIVFPSSASLEAFIDGCNRFGMEVDSFIKGLTVACLGNYTQQALESRGISVDILPSVPSVDDFIQCLIEER